MSVVFVNNSSETFTPTQSGAIATFIWECCRMAMQSDAERPCVITRRAVAPAYDYAKTITLDYPAVGGGRLETLLWRAERKLNGWRHLRQRAYAARVADAIETHHLADRPLILHNDPEMAVYLRERFPQATIVHHFHNLLDCKPGFRAALAGARPILTAVSRFTAQWVEEYYHLPRGSVAAIHNGVDVERFSPGPAAAGRCVLNFVGRTGREKAPDLVLKAALILRERGRDLAVQIIGSNHWGRLEVDDYQRELESLARDLEQRGVAVSRPGHVTRGDLPAAIRRAHIHIVPSRWDEPFGLTTLEGMACGLATVGSRTGGTPEIIGDAGLLFERDDAKSLADRVERLIADPALRQDYASRARQRALEFTWENTYTQLRRAALGTHASPPESATNLAPVHA